MAGRLNDVSFLVGHWPLNSHADDVSGHGNDGTWTGEAYITNGRGRSMGDFDGADDKVAIGSVYNGIKSVAFGCVPDTATEQFLELNGSVSVTVSGGTIATGGWTAPTVYVDGVLSSTLVADSLQHVVITSATGINASSLNLGVQATNFGNISLGNVRVYSVALTQDEVLELSRMGVPKQSTIRRTTANGPDSSLVLQTLIPDASDMSGNGNDGTPTDVVLGDGGVFDGVDGKSDHGDIGNIQEVSFWVKPDSATEELILIDTGNDIMVSGGTIIYTGLTPSATYVNGAATTTLAAGFWQYIVCQFTQVDANNFEVGTDGGNFGAFSMRDLQARTSARSADTINVEYLRTRKYY